MKRTYLLLSCCFILLIFLILQWPDSKLHLIVCNVGQGDAILLKLGSVQVLVDGGKDEKVIGCLARYIPLWDRTIEVMVATHPDADHIGGLASVLDNYSVEKLVLTSSFKQTADFERFYQAVQREALTGMELIYLTELQKLELERELTGWIWNQAVENNEQLRENTIPTETQLSAVKLKKKEKNVSSNDLSIVVFLKYGRVSTLLTGDLEESGELALIKSGLLNTTTILKVGHHGSKSSTSTAFLKAVRPEIAVISAGKNNSYGHPTHEVLARLHEFGVTTYRTDEEGSIELITDGERVWRR